MKNMEKDRIVLQIPVAFTAEELAKYCRVNPDSSAFEIIEEMVPVINQWAKPRAILRYAQVESVDKATTVINGTTFVSRIVAEKMQGLQHVYLSVVTEGDELEKCEELDGDPFLDTYKGAVLRYATQYVIRYLKEQCDFDGTATLNPGSLPDWPIGNNIALLDLISDPGEIGVSYNEAGYMKPWNSGSHIHFSGDGYQNCSLCRNYSCIGRRAAFDEAEYERIFGKIEE